MRKAGHAQFPMTNSTEVQRKQSKTRVPVDTRRTTIYIEIETWETAHEEQVAVCGHSSALYAHAGRRVEEHRRRATAGAVPGLPGRIGVRNPHAPARPDGTPRVPTSAEQRARRRGRVSGGISRSGARGGQN